MNIWRISKILLQATPNKKSLLELKRQISQIERVSSIENVHFWTLDGEHHVFLARIFIEDIAFSKTIRQQISKITANFNIVDSTIELLEK